MDQGREDVRALLGGFAAWQRAGLPVEMPWLDTGRVIQAMKHDKKIVGGKVRFVLPRAIGDVFVTDEVSLSLVEEVLGG